MSRRYGVHGGLPWPGKLDLPELREVDTAKDLAWGRGFVAARGWREAVTYRETAPHEYVVRKWKTDEEWQEAFDPFVTSIRRFGYADARLARQVARRDSGGAAQVGGE